MKKKVGIIKRALCIGLVFLLSINSFAAVVSDNDGSAFITKAEFDSLKNTFQTQINQYNTSIDSKVDGAIASYLAGIRVAGATEVPLCGGNVKRLAFFTPSVQTTNWNRGQMGLDVTQMRSGMMARNGSFDYHGVYHISRDSSAHPFEAIIVKDGGLFYTNTYELDYIASIYAWYFNTGQYANWQGYRNGEFCWHCYDGGKMTYITNSGAGSDGGGLGLCSHYPLRSDWWQDYPSCTYGGVVGGSTTKMWGKVGSASSYPCQFWTVTNRFEDNLGEVDKQFFCTQGSTTTKKLQVWNYSLTTITSVADLSSGWTTATKRTASLPSDNDVIIDNVYGGNSIAQNINWTDSWVDKAGKWLTSTNKTASDYVSADTWYEPELQMVEQDQEISWIDQSTYTSNVGIDASTWTAKPYNGFPIAVWKPNWTSLEFDVNNTNSASLRLAFSDTQFAKDSWIQDYSNSKIKIELDGSAVTGSNFALPTGSHKIKIIPTTTIGQLFVTVGWNSTSTNTRGYLDIPNIGTAVIE